MGLFKKKSTCDICGSPKGKEIKDGFVCNDCWNKTGYFGAPLTLNKKIATLKQVNERIKLNDQWNTEQEKRNEVFNYTIAIGDKLLVDEENKLWCINAGLVNTKQGSIIYSFDDIEDFELNEDGETVLKSSLLKTSMGALAFGGVGAIIGASSKKAQEICKDLSISISIKNQYFPVYIHLINTDTKKNSLTYKVAIGNAESIAKYFNKYINN